MKSFLIASLALASCAVFAGIDQKFTDGTLGALPENGWEGWSGDGSITQAEQADATQGNVLSVDGKVTCVNGGTASRWSKLSLMVKAPTEASEELTGEDVAEDCQFAVSTGAEVDGALKVMVYQKKSGTESEYEWVATDKTVPKGAWFAVNLEFDYAVQKVRVAVNNAACATEYDLVSPRDATSKIAALDVVGSSNVDDVNIQEAAAEEACPEVLKGYKVYLSDLGISSVDELKNDSNKANKVAAGLDPNDANVAFYADTLTAATDGSVAITVPCAYDNGQEYELWINGKKSDDASWEFVRENNKIKGVKIQVAPAAGEKVLKFQVKAKAAQN